MVAISFKREWRKKLLSGEKAQTVRPYSETQFQRIKDNPILQIYINQRSPDNEFLFEAELEEVFGLVPFRILNKDYHDPLNDAARLEIKELVKRDGFTCYYEMKDWFRKQYGEIYRDMEFMVIRFKPVLGVMCAECKQMHYTEQARIPDKCSNCGNDNPDRFFAVNSREARFVKVTE